MDIKQNLTEFCNKIEEIDIDLYTNEKTKTLIFPDLAIMKDAAESCKYEDNLWRYNIRPMRIKLPNTPPKCRPDYIKNIEITLKINNEISLPKDKHKISDPIKKLNFDIEIKSDTNNICSWHLDKHSQLSNDEDGVNKYIHPEYHFSYGGKRMEGLSDYGETLLLRSPRLMHPPLDVILGIDFIINQFITNEYSKYFIINPIYQKIVAEMKKLIWKPYCLALANNFYKEWNEGSSFEKGYSKSLIS